MSSQPPTHTRHSARTNTINTHAAMTCANHPDLDAIAHRLLEHA